MTTDPRTLLIAGGLMSWILAASIEFQAVRPGRSRILPDSWSLGLLAQGAGLCLISQRGLMPDFWSISLANMLLMSTPLFFYIALQRIRGAQARPLLIASVPVGVGLALPIVGFADEAFPARAVVVLCAALVGLGLSMWSATQIARAERKVGAYMILGSSGLVLVVFAVFVASVVNGDVLGVLSGPGIQRVFYATNDASILLSTLGYMDLARIARNELGQIEDPMRPDPLTGLYSNDAFTRAGLDELQRARRRGYPVCAIALRIDGLERIKARRGPSHADATLRRVAGIVLKDVRTYDLAGRISKNTIGILLPELGLAAGVEAANRIRTTVARDPSNSGPGPEVRISAGVCEATGLQEGLDAIMAAAEECLRRAEEGGGDRVATPFSPPSRPSP